MIRRWPIRKENTAIILHGRVDFLTMMCMYVLLGVRKQYIILSPREDSRFIFVVDPRC